MSLSGTRLQGNMKPTILAQLQEKFPIPSGLQAAEITALNDAQDKLAEAIAFGSSPEIVTEITGHADVSVTGTVDTGLGAPGTISGSGGVS